MNRHTHQALAAVFTGHGSPIELREFPIPSPAAGEILIQITCGTICGSDVHTWSGRRMEPTPCVLGHEIVGRIAAFGPDCQRHDLRGELLSEGDRVTWTLAASCGDCFFCRHGLPQKCEHLHKYGHSAIQPGREFSGGFAEYCLLHPGTGVIRLTDAISDGIAAPANCAVATVAAALRAAETVKDSVVAVIGCGVLGLNACAMARDFGAGTIIACDIDPGRKDSAYRFGAHRFVDPRDLTAAAKELTHGRGADLALEFSGASSAVESGLACLRTGGRAIIAGTTTPGNPIPLDPNMLVRRMLTLRGLHNYAPCDLVTAVDFLERTAGVFPFADLCGEPYALDRINEAFQAAHAGSGRRVAVIPGI